MFFFAKTVRRINELHSTIFGGGDEVSGDEDSAGDDRSEDEPVEAFSLYNWFALIDTYCDTTRETFSSAWETEINYFLTVIEYAMEKNRRLLEKQKQMRLK